MTSRVIKFATNATTFSLTPIGADGAKLTGLEVVNTNASYDIFLKIFFGNNRYGGQGSGFSGAKDVPTIGTDVPLITIDCPKSASIWRAYQSPLQGQGRLFVAVTKLAADTDNTEVLVGDGLVSIFFE